MSGSAYRPDIDGLRAISIGAVLAAHLGMPRSYGGFVGVDVFFVISGFLIGSILVRELDEGTFTLRRFYERRVRRIVPALVVVLAATAAGGLLVLYPKPYVGFAKSLLATLASLSNVYFWQTSGYFSAPAYAQPLMHTWSLAVEEQFYLLFPPFLTVIWRLSSRRSILVVGAVAVVSFGVSAVGAFKAPNGTFFLPFGRAWELLLGVMLAIRALPAPRHALVRSSLALAGLALIGASIAFLSPLSVFPGLTALPPCFGAALVIVARVEQSDFVGRVIAWRPVVFIGLISYSLYLWHWPIIVLWEQHLGSLGADGLSGLQKLCVVVLSLALATLTWRFVERPFRRRFSARTVFVTAAIGVGGLSVIGGCLIALTGLPRRYSPEVLKLASYLDAPIPPDFKEGTCFIGSRSRFEEFQRTQCLSQRPGTPSVLFMGDSYAAHLMYGAARALPGVNLLQANAAGCRPTFARGTDERAGCAELTDFLYREYLPSHRPELLVLSARWRPADLPKIAETLDWLKQRNIAVLLVGSVAEYDGALPHLLARGIEEHDPHYPRSHLRDQSRRMDDALAELAETKKVDYASAYRALCASAECRYVAESGVPLQFDYGHLTQEGSLLVVKRFVEQGKFGALAVRN